MPGPEVEFDAEKLKDQMIDAEPGIPEDAKGAVKELVAEGVTTLNEAMAPLFELIQARLDLTEKNQIALAKKQVEFETFAWEFKRDMLDSFIDCYTVLKSSGGAVPDHYIPNLRSQSEQCSQALRELSQ